MVPGRDYPVLSHSQFLVSTLDVIADVKAGPEEPGKGGGAVELAGNTNSPSDDQSEPADQPTTASVPGTGRPLRKSTAWSSPPLA